MKVLRTLGLLIVGIATSAVGMASAGAHGDDAVIEVFNTEQVSGGVVAYAKLTYANDKDPVTDATFIAKPIGPDGSELPPVQGVLDTAKAAFRFDLPLTTPGRYTIKFSSVKPLAALEFPLEVAAVATSTTAPSASSTTAALSSTTAAPSPSTTTTSLLTVPVQGEESSSALVPVLIGVAVVAAIGAVTIMLMGRKNADSES